MNIRVNYQVLGLSFIATLLLFTTTFINAQQLIPKQIGEQWTYIDSATQQIKLQGLQMARPFVGEVGIIQKNGKWGAVNTQLAEIIPLKYKEIRYLTASVFACLQDNYQHLYGMSQVKISEKFQDIARLKNSQNLIVLANEEGNYGLMDVLGNVVIPFEYHAPPQHLGKQLLLVKKVKRGLYYGLFTSEGKAIIPCRYFEIKLWQEQFYKCSQTNGEFVIVDLNGRQVLEQELENIQVIYEHFVLMGKEDEDKQKVFIRKTQAIYEGKSARLIHPSFMSVEGEGGHHFLLSKEGTKLDLPTTYRAGRVAYNKILLFSNDRTAKARLIDQNGEEVLPPLYDQIISWTDRYAVVISDRKTYKMSLVALGSGSVLLEPVYNKINLFHYGYIQTIQGKEKRFLSENLFAVPIGATPLEGQALYYALKPQRASDMLYQRTDIPLASDIPPLIIPMDVYKVQPLTDGYRNQQFGLQKVIQFHEEGLQHTLVDKWGKVLSSRYRAMTYYQNGLIPVQQAVKIDGAEKRIVGAIDTEGKLVIPVVYDKIKKIHPQHLIVEKHGWSGVIDRNNQVIIPIEYNIIILAKSGYFYIKKFEKWGIAKLDGTIITAPTYDKIEQEQTPEGSFKATLNGKTILLDKNGKSY